MKKDKNNSVGKLSPLKIALTWYMDLNLYEELVILFCYKYLITHISLTKKSAIQILLDRYGFS